MRRRNTLPALRFVGLLARLLVARDPVAVFEPAAEIDVAAARRAERPGLYAYRLAADRAGRGARTGGIGAHRHDGDMGLNRHDVKTVAARCGDDVDMPTKPGF